MNLPSRPNKYLWKFHFGAPNMPASPAAASAQMYLDPQGKPTRDSVVGWRASGVPGIHRRSTVMAMGTAMLRLAVPPHAAPVA